MRLAWKQATAYLYLGLLNENHLAPPPHSTATRSPSVPPASTMYIPRTESEDCHISCTSSMDPPNDGSNTVPAFDYGKQGPHRYIGIAMVVFMIALAVAFWVYWTRFRKAKSRSGSELSSELSPPTSSTSRSSWFRCIVRAKSSSPPTNTEGTLGVGKLDEKSPLPKPLLTVEREKERKRRAGRHSASGYQKGRVIKEVSGGVVMYTEVPLPKPSLSPARDRHLSGTAEWQMEHVHGVCFEVSRII